MSEKSAQSLNVNIFEPPDPITEPAEFMDWFEAQFPPIPDFTNPAVVPPSSPPACTPGKFYDSDGRCWNVQCTADGPLLVRCFYDSVPRSFGSRVTGILLAHDHYAVRVLQLGETNTFRVPRGTIPLKLLGIALARDTRLPSRDPSAVPKSFWERLATPRASSRT